MGYNLRGIPESPVPLRETTQRLLSYSVLAASEVSRLLVWSGWETELSEDADDDDGSVAICLTMSRWDICYFLGVLQSPEAEVPGGFVGTIIAFYFSSQGSEGVLGFSTPEDPSYLEANEWICYHQAEESDLAWLEQYLTGDTAAPLAIRLLLLINEQSGGWLKSQLERYPVSVPSGWPEESATALKGMLLSLFE